ncbi:signal transduction histidine kinase [Paenibacillus sp. DS2015]|uniref:sensor histidine kinase n=1 Tax=Paenibacillus sp. DS2015 TaxID=3373917 RepID=UPI003D1B0CB9
MAVIEAKMKHWVSGVISLYLVMVLLMNGNLDYEQLFLVLSLVGVTILKDKFYNTRTMSVIALLLTWLAVSIDFQFAVLFTLVCYDCVLKRYYIAAASVPLLVCWYGWDEMPQILGLNLVLIVVCGFVAYTVEQGEQRKNGFQHTLDNERRLRYELEGAKAQLLHTSKEIASITEVKERNRIARDLHDSIGHNLTGILIQLQAAHKVHSHDNVKSMEIVSQSIKGLAHSVELLRDTVHNIKPRENAGVEYLQSIVDHYGFCEVKLKLSGDFNTVPSGHLEILSSTMKEALTNVARYSEATQVDISIDANEQYTRFYLKDNGKGTSLIREGMGLSGIKERVGNVGGRVSISGTNVFLIVCLIPRQEGVGIFEGANRG